MRAILICLFVASAFGGVFSATPEDPPAASNTGHNRLIVLTDIEADPDDTQSLIRLFLYANEIDLEGLVATTSIHQRNRTAPESIHHVIRQYAEVHDTLSRHAPGYPDADTLSAWVTTGQPVYGMAGIGEGRDTPGSDLIIAALEADDPRPLWVAAWGGPNTLAQALYTLRATRTPAEVARLTGKLRIYTISDQDDTGAWMRETFPDLFYIVSPGGYGAATWTGISHVVDGLDNTSISNDWLADNIQQGHGPFGAAYPDVAYGMEGDTPTFLNLVRNGLSDPEHPDWGGWGGRYEFYTPELSALDPDGFTGGVPVTEETRPIWTNAIDTLRPWLARPHGRAHGYGEENFTGYRATLWRWRDDIQNDFAARIDWTVSEYADANHPPIARLDHADRLTVHSGDTVALSALGSFDPDGDSLSYQWFHYREAGSFPDRIELWGADNLYARGFAAPEVGTAQTAHFILRVTDKGHPALSRYRRVIVTILPAARPRP
ncbi:nucleoside hydrolase-like domain-containing protein [Maricaulis sp.]|uniref:DUF1593 domain-containing protein n=1 Tax=Maricaulis sp. TaxID=1486257 RepID=UPI00262B9E7F|nr:nucleoside hydrolase-like domain-containing protein [Maricaulis sp.]MDF1770130.1 DUF1593 domain-containing protein [Maricaulis sp.]